MDRRKFNKGTKGNKGGRPRKIPFTSKIEKACENMLLGLLEDENIKTEVYGQLAKRLSKEESNSIGWVYIIKDGDIAKIGISSNIKSRLNTYRSHNPRVKLIYACNVNNPNTLERLLLDDVDVVSGDWFNYNESEVIKLIEVASNYLIS